MADDDNDGTNGDTVVQKQANSQKVMDAALNTLLISSGDKVQNYTLCNFDYKNKIKYFRICLEEDSYSQDKLTVLLFHDNQEISKNILKVFTLAAIDNPTVLYCSLNVDINGPRKIRELFQNATKDGASPFNWLNINILPSIVVYKNNVPMCYLLSGGSSDSPDKQTTYTLLNSVQIKSFVEALSLPSVDFYSLEKFRSDRGIVSESMYAPAQASIHNPASVSSTQVKEKMITDPYSATRAYSTAAASPELQIGFVPTFRGKGRDDNNGAMNKEPEDGEDGEDG